VLALAALAVFTAIGVGERPRMYKVQMKATMRRHYDFSKLTRAEPKYVRRLRSPVTMTALGR